MCWDRKSNQQRKRRLWDLRWSRPVRGRSRGMERGPRGGFEGACRCRRRGGRGKDGRTGREGGRKGRRARRGKKESGEGRASYKTRDGHGDDGGQSLEYGNTAPGSIPPANGSPTAANPLADKAARRAPPRSHQPVSAISCPPIARPLRRRPLHRPG